ncbi:hypothetical protein Fcan01_15475 [Folsomia candida]|uniref:Uncharacterized protein n=1 Tax=Folsomia candida TaxID=158441 RepID=A0A226DX86_FOLCA|nr:hypothetical protein Fcan01_15475 [Folsomia candida]
MKFSIFLCTVVMTTCRVECASIKERRRGTLNKIPLQNGEDCPLYCDSCSKEYCYYYDEEVVLTTVAAGRENATRPATRSTTTHTRTEVSRAWALSGLARARPGPLGFGRAGLSATGLGRAWAFEEPNLVGLGLGGLLPSRAWAFSEKPKPVSYFFWGVPFNNYLECWVFLVIIHLHLALTKSPMGSPMGLGLGGLFSQKAQWAWAGLGLIFLGLGGPGLLRWAFEPSLGGPGFEKSRPGSPLLVISETKLFTYN